jgi:hypothetical protein
MVLKWEVIKCEMTPKGFLSMAPETMRAKVPGGWFILAAIGAAGGSFFYPDPEHLWDGASLP